MTQKRTKDIMQWDVKSWSKALSYWDRNIVWDKVQNGLELGGREGGLSLWLALKGKTVVCSDLKNVKETAQQLHLQYNIASLITYQDIDATDIPYENYFDIIVFKSIIGGIAFIIDGTAKYIESGREYDMMKSKFSFLTRVLEITVDNAKQML